MKPVDKTLGLTTERLREVLDYDLGSGIFVWKKKPHKSMSSVKVGDIAGSLDNTGYIRIWIDNKRYVAHRLAWLYVHGKWPTEQIDHIDGNKKNNRWSNLREATHAENIHNRKAYASNKLKLKGVELHVSGKYRARIKRKHLGLFNTAEEAANAYRIAARSLFGEFAGE